MPEVVFRPASACKEIADHVGREGFASSVVVNEDPPPVRVLVDSLAAFALNEEKALAFEGSDNAAGRDITEERNRWVARGHTVTATAGSLMTLMVASWGIFSPAFCIA